MFRIPGLPKKVEVCARRASMDDVTVVRAIAESSGIDVWTGTQYAEEIVSKRSIILVAELDDDPVGFVLGRVIPGSIAGTEAEIYNIAVTYEARRKGIGQMLLARAIESFISKACSCVWLEVRSSNSVAIQFYENNGFSKSGVRRGFYANPVEDAIVMRLDLTGKATISLE